MQAESILSHHSSVYSIVTEQILKQLESGVAPWHRPWTTRIPRICQRTRISRNQRVSARQHGYGSPYWLTYKQATNAVDTSAKASTAPELSSGRSAREKPKTQTETLSSESLSCFATTPCSTSSNVKGFCADCYARRQPIEECERIVQQMPNPPAMRARRARMVQAIHGYRRDAFAQCV